jgi:predicted nucleic acid-binding protein
LSALVLAEAKQAPLVTSDGALREFARQRGLSVHGTLWVLDQLVEVHRILKPSHGAQAIHEMLMRNNRLPRDECNDRMVKWRQQDE